jgi:hypothetical protein
LSRRNTRFHAADDRPSIAGKCFRGNAIRHVAASALPPRTALVACPAPCEAATDAPLKLADP